MDFDLRKMDVKQKQKNNNERISEGINDCCEFTAIGMAI